MMKKLLCVLLAALMLVGTLASCATGGEGEDTTASGTQNDSNAESETRETLDIPAFAAIANEIVRRKQK